MEDLLIKLASFIEDKKLDSKYKNEDMNFSPDGIEFAKEIIMLLFPQDCEYCKHNTNYPVCKNCIYDFETKESSLFSRKQPIN